ncbi:unnamed protein product [Ilex paraguariensis]|uniref:Mannosyltransferase n=1 Tax=Ilex paraguariensis TaxID=185542 RepID=A0ABC8RWQ2_9AQUA
MVRASLKCLQLYGYDLLLGSIAAFYVFMVPYTKVEESFNVQAMNDFLYHHHHIDKYDHLEFPGVVPRTFIGALVVSILASPITLTMNLLHLPKLYGLFAARLVLGSMILSTLRFFRVQTDREGVGGKGLAVLVSLLKALSRRIYGCLLGSLGRAVLSSLRNNLILVLPVYQLCCSEFTEEQFDPGTSGIPVNLAYGYWFKGSFYAALQCLICATIIFRCDMLLLLSPFGLELLLTKSVSFWKGLKCCIGTALFCIGLTMLVDSIMWRKLVWPEFEVFWFNSVLNRSSEWGTHPFHWYFTSALPRSLLAAYPLFLLGVILDRRVLFYILPVFSFVLLYSKLPHKELRFIISSIPIFNLSAAIAASRVYNNRRKSFWKLLNIVVLGLLLVSLGCTIISFMASYQNYPGGYALKALHRMGQNHLMIDLCTLVL